MKLKNITLLIYQNIKEYLSEDLENIKDLENIQKK